MRAVIQRVRQASVHIADREVAAIGRGLLVLLGIEAGDADADQEWLLAKVAHQRLFSDGEGRMNLDCAAVGGSFLVVSQFTLFASTRKGTRPGFSRAALPEVARGRYQAFCTALAQASGCPVAQGVFAADMQVSLCNDGPVTVIIDSRLRE